MFPFLVSARVSLSRKEEAFNSPLPIIDPSTYLSFSPARAIYRTNLRRGKRQRLCSRRRSYYPERNLTCRRAHCPPRVSRRLIERISMLLLPRGVPGRTVMETRMRRLYERKRKERAWCRITSARRRDKPILPRSRARHRRYLFVRV